MKDLYGGLKLEEYPLPIRLIITKMLAATQSKIDLMDVGKSQNYSFSDIIKMCGYTINNSYIDEDFVIKRYNDKDLESLFKYRSKNDRVIRRGRMSDIMSFINGKREYRYIYKILNYFMTSMVDFDYITVSNVLIASLFFGEQWFKNWFSIGSFEKDIFSMSDIMSNVSDKLKQTGCNMQNWEMYLECKNLTGYRNPPYGDFNIKKEAEELAHSGINHYWSQDINEYSKMVHEMLFTTPDKFPDRMGYKQYIASGIWSRSGSSSLGKIEIEINGDKIKFKARKNQLLYLYTVDELYDLSLKTKAQINYAFVKPETGKLRIAVSSDVLTYLKMSYIYYCAGDFYLKWKGITSTESVNSECNRLKMTLDLIVVNWGMPFDYKGFDHQPELREIASLDKVFHDVGRLNVDDLNEYDAISANVTEGWNNAKLIVRDNDEITEYDVSGGLMSGLFNTAAMNNAWNATNAYMAISALTYILNIGDIFINIKGDDSSFINRSAYALQMLEFTLRIMDLKGGIGKFGIIQYNTEFLRTWFKDRSYGYPSRNIPGLMQNKPWSENGDWTPYTNVKAIIDVSNIISRRLNNNIIPIQFAQHIASRWARSHNLPYNVFNIPTKQGGYGMLEWDGISQIAPPIPLFKLPRIIVTAPLKYGQIASNIQNRCNTYGLEVDSNQAQQLAYDQFVSTISSGDIPSIRKKLRDAYFTYQIGDTKQYKIHRLPKILVYDLNVNYLIRMKDAISNYSKLQDRNSSYASLSHEVNIINEFQPILKILHITLKQFCIMNNFKIINKLRNKDHFTDTLDWYGGRYQFPATNLNNKIISLVQRDILSNYRYAIKVGAFIANSCYRAYTMYSNTYFNMALHRSLLLW